MGHERWKIRMANEAWESVMTAHAKLVSQFADEGVFDEVSMREYDVLYTLVKARRPLRLSELQEGILLSQPALSRLVERMVQRGLLSSCGDSEDRRAIQVSLTDQGAELQQRVGRAHARSVTEKLTSSLSDEEMRQLRSIASKLTAAARASE